jgi:nucleoside-diphosphate-sugar epimerase
MKAFVTGGSGFLGRNLIPFLKERGIAVWALARSPEAIDAVTRAGAKPVEGDLTDRDALIRGMRSATYVFHSAAYAKDWGPKEKFFEANVTGTERVLEAAREAGVERVVHVGTEAVLVGGGPIVRADETRPLPDHSIGLYPLTKKLAEQAVLASDVDTVVIRPRLIWGKGDTTVLAELMNAVKEKRFAWIGGGRYLTSTCHVKNVCHGALLAAERGKKHSVYFLTDGEPVELRTFLTEMLKTQGCDPGSRTVPWWAASATASIGEAIFNRLGKRPPLTRSSLELIGREVTVDDRRAREDLGYTPIVSIEDGLAEMRADYVAK